MYDIAFSIRTWLFSLLVSISIVCGSSESLFGQTTDSKPTQNPQASIEEVDDEIVAIVLGKGIYASEVALSRSRIERYKNNLTEDKLKQQLDYARAKKFDLLIYPPILKAYAKKHGIEPTEKEINLLYDDFNRNRDVTAAGVADESSRFMRQFVERIVRSWNTSKFMYEKHGGRVGLSKFGLSVSFPGRQALLKEQKKLGNFAFQNEADEKLFWKRVNDESGLDMVIEGDEAKKYFETTPWESARAVDDRRSADR